MRYTIASINRIKISKENVISLFLVPAGNFRIIMEAETSLLIVDSDDKIDCYKSSDTEFKLNPLIKSINYLLTFWIEKKSLLRIELDQYNSNLINSIEMYEDKR